MQLKYLPVRSGTIDTGTVNTTIHTMLDKEMIENKCTSWNKLDKTHKLTLINQYVDILAETPPNNMTSQAVIDLKKYLSDGLDKKRLNQIKDVVYNRETKTITSIPLLHFNPISNKYTLKRAEKRVSTLKSLGKGSKGNVTNNVTNNVNKTPRSDTDTEN